MLYLSFYCVSARRPVRVRIAPVPLSRFLVVLICLVLSVLTTIDRFSTALSIYVYWIEIFLVLFFGAEYAMRLWSAGCRSKYMGFAGRMRFARKPIAIVGKTACARRRCRSRPRCVSPR